MPCCTIYLPFLLWYKEGIKSVPFQNLLKCARKLILHISLFCWHSFKLYIGWQTNICIFISRRDKGESEENKKGAKKSRKHGKTKKQNSKKKIFNKKKSSKVDQWKMQRTFKYLKINFLQNMTHFIQIIILQTLKVLKCVRY